MTACKHCGLDIPPGSGSAFCCPGCETAYALINGAGLQSYYQRREIDAKQSPLRPDETASVETDRFTVDNADGTRTLHLMVEGLHCAACVWLIESILGQQRGVRRARVNMTTRRLELVWTPQETDAEKLIGTVTALGYGLMPYDPALLEQQNTKSQRELLRAMAVAGFAAGNVMMLSVAVWAGAGDGGGGGEGPITQSLFHWVSALIALPAILYAGRPFFRSAAKVLAHGRTNMDVPISLALLLTGGMSLFETFLGGHYVYFESATMLLFFLLVGRYLDRRARAHAEAQAERLSTLLATSATVVDADGTRRVVAIHDLKPGMVVLVQPGERIPVDGDVADGDSDLDCSLITGESLPRAVAPGAGVHAGTQNLSAAITVTVQAVGEDTLLAEISRLMETAERARGRYVAIADRVARLYAPVVHSVALLTFLGWTIVGGLPWQEALMISAAVLIITCPCALALAVPVVHVLAVSNLMRRGVLVKSPTALERLADVDTVVFDKTGTLTRAALELDAAPDDKAGLELAARMAAASTHPLARALVQAFENTHGPVGAETGVVEVPGSGLEANGVRLGRKSWAVGDAPDHGDGDSPEMWLARPGLAPLRFTFADPPRADAPAVVRALEDKGYAVQLLSGDTDVAVSRAAQQTGIETFAANLRPADKIARIEALARQNHTVMMVGDGLNDAPALASAHVSASPTGAADITRTAADLVYQGTNLAPVPATLRIAKRVRALVRQNIGFALLYNAVTIPIAAAGLITPLIAAASMSASSIVVIVNALRLNREN